MSWSCWATATAPSSPTDEADQAVALAVADLTGNGAKDFIYADQGLDRVVVHYGASPIHRAGRPVRGLLSPGAVKLADLNGDGIPDLIVANSGSNNVLVYPGLGNGQFGPASTADTASSPAQPDRDHGRRPERPARPDGRRRGSNDVSVLLGQGKGRAGR